MPSPVKTKGPNCDWLGIAPDNARSRLSTDTLIILNSPVITYPTSSFDSTSTVSSEELEISDLDTTLLKCGFKDGQYVWVKVESDVWTRGYIYGKLRTRQQMARTRTFETFWPVVCGASKIAWFSPANGDIKPDTPRVRELLRKEYDIEK